MRTKKRLQQSLEAMHRALEFQTEAEVDAGTPLEQLCYTLKIEDPKAFMARLMRLEEKWEELKQKRQELLDKRREKRRRMRLHPVDVGNSLKELREFMALWSVQSDPRDEHPVAAIPAEAQLGIWQLGSVPSSCVAAPNF
jgi:hypothetical protein